MAQRKTTPRKTGAADRPAAAPTAATSSQVTDQDVAQDPDASDEAPFLNRAQRRAKGKGARPDLPSSRAAYPGAASAVTGRRMWANRRSGS